MIHCQLRKQLYTAQGPLVLDVDFTINKGEILALMGPSGSGKTTLLRLLAGLMRPDHGRIAAPDGIWVDTETGAWRRPQYRPVGMVFQDYALFPNMTVRQNLAYALPRGESAAWLDELLHIMELTALRDVHPHRLSGGQRQRVALARALVRRPRLLLLDEPLSALDRELRRRLQNYLLDAHQRFGLTIILVTHDLSEVYKVAHRALRLEGGRLTARTLPRSGDLEEVPAWMENGELIGEIMDVLPEHREVIVLIGENVLRVPAGHLALHGLSRGRLVRIRVAGTRPSLLLEEE